LVEKLGRNAQQGGAGYYTITVSEDTYNALNMFRALCVNKFLISPQ